MSGPSSCGTPSSARFRVLVVDERPVNLESHRQPHWREGHRSELRHERCTGSPERAVTRPDLVLLEVAMPDMDGYEVARSAAGGSRPASCQ